MQSYREGALSPVPDSQKPRAGYFVGLQESSFLIGLIRSIDLASGLRQRAENREGPTRIPVHLVVLPTQIHPRLKSSQHDPFSNPEESQERASSGPATALLSLGTMTTVLFKLQKIFLDAHNCFNRHLLYLWLPSMHEMHRKSQRESCFDPQTKFEKS